MLESPALRLSEASAAKNALLTKKFTFDELIERMGINRFNTRVFLFIGLFMMADGSEMVVLSLLITKLTEIWSLSSFQKGALGSSIFIGFAIGSLCSGIVSDRKGRRPAYLLGSWLVLIFASLSSFAQGFLSFIALRVICGFGIGLAIPALFALVTELTPSAYRSLVLNNVWSVFPIGAAFVILMTKFFIETEYGWRYILLFASIPCFFVIVFSLKVPESPRFYMSNGSFDKGFEELEKIVEFADLKDKVEIKEKEKQELIYEAQLHHLSHQEADYKMLFTPEYRRLTFLICSVYFLVSFIYYGATYILPQIFEEEYSSNRGNVGDVYFDLLVGCFFEVPACVLAGYLGNHRYLLRIRTMVLGFAVNGICTLIILIFPKAIVIAAALFRSSIAISFNVMFVYACEAYPTKIRSMGVGLGNTCTRFAAILTPFISQFMFDCYEKMPFFGFGVGAVLGVVACLALPYETGNRGLK